MSAVDHGSNITVASQAEFFDSGEVRSLPSELILATTKTIKVEDF